VGHRRAGSASHSRVTWSTVVTWDLASLLSLLLSIIGAGVAGLATLLTYRQRRNGETAPPQGSKPLGTQERPGARTSGRSVGGVLSADVLLRMDSGETLVVTLQSPAAVQRLLNEGVLGPRAAIEIQMAQQLLQERDDERWKFSLLTSLMPLVMALTMVVILREPRYLLFAAMSPLMFAAHYASRRRHLRRPPSQR
jgi:hypothetical protein